MSKIRTEDYNPSHLEKIRPKEIHKDSMPNQIRSRAVSLLVDDLVLAIFGGFYVSKGVFQIWGIVSNDVRRYPVSFYKHTKSLLSFFEKKESPRRIQIDIRVSHKDLSHWAKSLGFSPEGIMRAYESDGEDCWLFAKVRPHGVG